MSITAKYRAWCFTLNNYNDVDVEHLQTVVKTLARYIVFGKEVGKDGTPHLQGYVYFHNARQRKAVARLLPRAHLEPSSGSPTQNRTYCAKDGDFFEHGEIPMESNLAREKGGAATKARYAAALVAAESGTLDSIKRDDPQLYILHGPRLESLYAPTTAPLDGELLHEWWVGPSGSGKSRLLWELYPNHFPKALNKWWDRYRHEDVVAIEEWAPKNDCTASALKKWADRYPFPGEIKGGVMQKLRPRKVIVLSNYTPQQCFLNSEDLEPILRRFTVINFPSQEQHARFRAQSFVEITPLDTPLDLDDLPDLDLDGSFFDDI